MIDGRQKSMARDLGILAMVIGACASLMGVLVFSIPEPDVVLGVVFLAVGVSFIAGGAVMAVTKRPRRLDRPPPPPQADTDGEKRPKSIISQILSALAP